MEILNILERRSAIMQFWAFLIITVLSIPVFIILYFNLPFLETNPVATPVETVSPERLNDTRHALVEIASKLRKVHITVLVDATPGMENYIPSVAEAVASWQENERITISAASYRDAVEGPWLFTTNEMQSKQPAYWLKKLYTEVYQDQDEPEAVYYGLKSALSLPNFVEGETNILVLVGDAGNHAQDDLTDISPTDIQELMNQYRCHFLAVQTRKLAKETYQEFGNQLLKDIIQPVSEQLQLELHTSRDGNQETISTTKPLQLELKHLKQIGELEPDQLQHTLQNKVNQIISTIDTYATSLENIGNGNSQDLSWKEVQPLIQPSALEEADFQMANQ